MIENLELPVTTMGETFTGIQELGFSPLGHLIISMFTTPAGGLHRGTWFTALAISPLSYRKKHPTKAAVSLGNGYLTIVDDWGNPHQIEADESVLQELLRDCVAHGVFVVPVSEIF